MMDKFKQFNRMQQAGIMITAASLISILLLFIMENLFISELIIAFEFGIGIYYIGSMKKVSNEKRKASR